MTDKLTARNEAALHAITTTTDEIQLFQLALDSRSLDIDRTAASAAISVLEKARLRLEELKNVLKSGHFQQSRTTLSCAGV